VPARFSAIERAAGTFGITVVAGGKHNKKLTRPGYRCYTIPAHNGGRSEISDVYIAGLCRNFQIEEAEFRSRL
jgi:hypothetical protein